MKMLVFDGPTACGKTSLMEKTGKELLKHGIKVDMLSERNILRDLIDKLQIGDIIRSRLPPITESLLWMIDQAYKMEVELPMKKSELILVDMYIYTPIVYQYLLLKDKGVGLEKILDYISRPFGLQLPKADISFVLIASLKTLKKRFKQREGREMNQLEENLTAQAIDIYIQLGDFFKDYYVINSDRPMQGIYSEVESLLLDYHILKGGKEK